MQKYSTRFDGLEPSSSYIIHISTELEEKPVVQTKQQFKTRQQTAKEQTEQTLWFVIWDWLFSCNEQFKKWHKAKEQTEQNK